MDSKKIGNNQFTFKSLEERFWTKVCVSDSNKCWNWNAKLSKLGYGQFRFNGKIIEAHRISYMIFHKLERLPDENICHICDNRKCCNPSHLYAGTRKDNMRDKSLSGRNKMSKLNFEQVKEIRKRFSSGESKKSLSNFYKVSVGTIWDIVNNRSWKYEGNPEIEYLERKMKIDNNLQH